MNKGLETLDLIKFLANGRFELDYEPIEKELKALEVIKEKEVDAEMLFEYWKANCEDTFEMYNFLNDLKPLSQEEYDLLKEVLK